jgi:hypothetical protein
MTQAAAGKQRQHRENGKPAARLSQQVFGSCPKRALHNGDFLARQRGNGARRQVRRKQALLFLKKKKQKNFRYEGLWLGCYKYPYSTSTSGRSSP